jgi:hypothetical protein
MAFSPIRVDGTFKPELFRGKLDGDHLDVKGTYTLPVKPNHAPFLFKSVTVHRGGVLTCSPWSATNPWGGAVRLRVSGALIVQEGGLITAANCGVCRSSERPRVAADDGLFLEAGRAGCIACRSGGVVDIEASVITLDGSVHADSVVPSDSRPTIGTKVCVMQVGRVGVITTDDHSSNPYIVQFDDDNRTSGWLTPKEVRIGWLVVCVSTIFRTTSFPCCPSLLPSLLSMSPTSVAVLPSLPSPWRCLLIPLKPTFVMNAVFGPSTGMRRWR